MISADMQGNLGISVGGGRDEIPRFPDSNGIFVSVDGCLARVAECIPKQLYPWTYEVQS